MTYRFHMKMKDHEYNESRDIQCSVNINPCYIPCAYVNTMWPYTHVHYTYVESFTHKHGII